MEAPIDDQDNLGGKESEKASENESRHQDNHEVGDILERLGFRPN